MNDAVVKKSTGIGKGTPGPGRGRGNPNKITKQLKDMILGALDECGGQAYLVRQAKAEPRAFLALLARVLPTEIKGDQQITVAGLDWHSLLKPKGSADAP
ncbi:MAG: hypothetical protein IT518_25065 [Burkholderiales bacterium]|nr:hypothetical protein [Burkholderiales bacterium]